MMQQNHKIKVSPQPKNSDYTITIGENIIDLLGKFITQNYADYQLVVVTDKMFIAINIKIWSGIWMKKIFI